MWPCKIISSYELFFTPTHKTETGLQVCTWETTNSKPPGAINTISPIRNTIWVCGHFQGPSKSSSGFTRFWLMMNLIQHFQCIMVTKGLIECWWRCMLSCLNSVVGYWYQEQILIYLCIAWGSCMKTHPTLVLNLRTLKCFWGCF